MYKLIIYINNNFDIIYNIKLKIVMQIDDNYIKKKIFNKIKWNK